MDPNAMGPEWEEDLSGGEVKLTGAKVYELGKGYYEGRNVTGFWEGCYRIDNGRPRTSCEEAPEMVKASKVNGRGRRLFSSGGECSAEECVFVCDRGYQRQELACGGGVEVQQVGHD